MADYQSLLTRAVANLPPTSTAASRQAIYDRARRALVTQLRSLRPPLPESDIAREETALDKAIAAVEANFAPSDAPPPAPSPTALAARSPPPPAAKAPAAPVAKAPSALAAQREAAPHPPSPAAPHPPSRSGSVAPVAASSPGYVPTPAPVRPAPAPSPAAAARPGAPGTPPSSLVEPRPAPARPSTAVGAARSNVSPVPARPIVPSRGEAAGPKPPPIQVALPNAAGAAAPPVIAAQADEDTPAANLASVAPGDRTSLIEAPDAPPITASRAEDAEDGAPALEPAFTGVMPRSEGEGVRPVAPSAPVEKRRTWPWAALAVIFGIVLSVAVVAIVMRQKPQDLAIHSPAPPPEAAQTPAKIAQRAQPSTEAENAAPPAAAPPVAAPQAAAPPAAAPGEGQPQTAQPAAEGGAPSDTQSHAPAEAPAPATLPTAARAAMLIASADNPQKPVVNLGSTVWSTIPGPQDQPSGVAVQAEADIPDLKMHASMILRKNTDPTLQATHTIDLKFTFKEGASFNGFKDVGLPQTRKLDSAASEALSAAKVKIGDDYFLFALAKGDQDAARNLDLMQTRAWFDFPLLLNDGRIAKLVFQKSAEGDAMLQKAFDAWK